VSLPNENKTSLPFFLEDWTANVTAGLRHYFVLKKIKETTRKKKKKEYPAAFMART
jgi:hypothetical protein